MCELKNQGDGLLEGNSKFGIAEFPSILANPLGAIVELGIYRDLHIPMNNRMFVREILLIRGMGCVDMCILHCRGKRESRTHFGVDETSCCLFDAGSWWKREAYCSVNN